MLFCSKWHTATEGMERTELLLTSCYDDFVKAALRLQQLKLIAIKSVLDMSTTRMKLSRSSRQQHHWHMAVDVQCVCIDIADRIWLHFVYKRSRGRFLSTQSASWQAWTCKSSRKQNGLLSLSLICTKTFFKLTPNAMFCEEDYLTFRLLGGLQELNNLLLMNVRLLAFRWRIIWAASTAWPYLEVT